MLRPPDAKDLSPEVARLRSALARARVCAPSGVEGVDPSGTIMVRLDADGLPQHIAVVGQWPSRTVPVDVGMAVGQAFVAASHARLRAWAAHLAACPPSSPAADPAPETPPLPPPRPRAVGDLIEGAITALAAAAAPAKQATGEAAHGQLRLALSASGVSCFVDQRWAALQSAATLQHALDHALRGARAERAAGDGRGSELDQLLADALGALSGPSSTRPSAPSRAPAPTRPPESLRPWQRFVQDQVT